MVVAVGNSSGSHTYFESLTRFGSDHTPAQRSPM